MNSVLNPEAPEFYPHLASFTQVQRSNLPQNMLYCAGDCSAHFAPYPVHSQYYEAYSLINKTVKSSNKFPSGASRDFLKTFTDFNIIKCQFNNNVINQSNEIFTSEMPSVKLSENNLEYNTELVIGYNDRIVDRIDLNMETLNKMDTVYDQLEDDMNPGTSNASNWNSDLVISKIQMGTALFIGAKNVPRPQLTFKDPVDNTDKLWVPKITDKPNNIKPLALSIIYNDNGEPVGYENPYKVEIDLYEPPQVFIDPDSEPPRFPLPMAQTKFTFIDTESQIYELVEHLNTVQELAVDVEHHSYRTYQGFTCLIQITTDEGGDFIIDALAVREHIHNLNLVFTDPRKLKVFHGADMDVLWLQRDFGVYIVGLFDTYQAAKTLAFPGLSLKHLLMKYCQINADKKYQLADWRMRPLPDELIEYARQDTHYLLYVWRCMKADLLAAVGDSDRLLRSVFTRSKFTCSATYRKLVMNDASYMALYVRSKRTFDARQMAAFKMLYKWRDAQARQFDESTSYILPNHMLLALSGTLPREIQGMNACCSPMPPFIKQNLITVHRMLLSCRELPLGPLIYPEPSTSRVASPMRRRPVLAYNVHDLSQFPKLVKDDKYTVHEPIEMPQETDNNKPSLAAIVSDEDKKADFMSTLNVNALMYIPPYYRYRGYRFLAKDEEIRQLEAKEAKIAAIAQGDPLIKSEVLEKLHMTKKALESFGRDNIETPVQRKRKISSDTYISVEHTNAELSDNKPSSSKVVENAKSNAKNVIPFNYAQTYTELYDNRAQLRKQVKVKLSKLNK